MASIWATGTWGRLYQPVWATNSLPWLHSAFWTLGRRFQHWRVAVAGLRHTESHYFMLSRWRRLRHVQRVQAAPVQRLCAFRSSVYQTFAHIRYVDVSALVVPFLIAGPLSQHLSWTQLQQSRKVIPPARMAFVAAIAALVIATGVIVATMETDAANGVPRVAVEKLKELKANRALSATTISADISYSQGIPTFIDLRAELYGPAFLARYMRAIWLEDPANFGQVAR